MDSSIRLYFDERVQVEVAEPLRRRGIDALTVRDIGLLGEPDPLHLQRAAEMNRVLCTYDYDFLRLHAEGIEHCGIVIARHFDTTIGKWVRGIERICAVMSAEEMRNQVEYL